MLKILRSRRAEGYIDVVALILAAMLVIALVVRVAPVFIVKQQIDTFATELMREAEIHGRVGAETTQKAARLRSEIGINPSISWSRAGNIQLGGEISVTVEMTVDIGLFGDFASFPVKLQAKALGKSEVYYK